MGVDLRCTDWGAKGEFEWCPTLAVAMPDDLLARTISSRSRQASR
jgi:hypothetical protein